MEKINKKFAWIVDGSGANSWGVKNDEAIHLKDGTPFINPTFSFDIVPPILNRGIQPATFPKALLVLIIIMTMFIRMKNY